RHVGAEVHRSPDAGIAFAWMSLPMAASRDARSDLRVALRTLFRCVGRGELSRLHDQVRKSEMLLAACKRIRELLPAAVRDPSSHDGVAEEQLRLPQIVEQGERRVDAQ